jgi:hypothetical protein
MKNRFSIRRSKLSTKILLSLFLLLLIMVAVVWRQDYQRLHSAWPHSVGAERDLNQLQSCVANPQDQCIGAPAVDFYPRGSEAATNPDWAGYVGNLKEIMGRITKINDTSVILQTTSGRLFTVNFPIDAVTSFNQAHADSTQPLQVAMGDALFVRYSEASNFHDTTITSQQLFDSALLLKGAVKTGPLEKY